MDEPAPVTIRNSRPGLAEVVLDRPHRRNAFNEAMIFHLTAAFTALAADRSVRLVVLRGAGAMFCAGADLEWMRRQGEQDEAANQADALALAEMLHALASLPQATLCLVQGGAYGGGLGLMAACDRAVAVAGAGFCFSEVKLGLTPATISPYVVAAIGVREAKALFSLALPFDTERALRNGLIEAVVADEAGLEAVLEASWKLAQAAAPGAVADSRQLVDDVAGREPDHALRLETAKRIAARRAGPEGREGLAAFLAKRKPAWAEG